MAAEDQNLSSLKGRFAAKPYHPVTTIDVLYRHCGKIVISGTLLILGAIALIRSEPKDIPKVLSAILTSGIFCKMGWIVAALILIFSIIFGILMWKIYPAELKRVCQERDRLQEKLIGKEVNHSGRGE